MNIVTYYDTLHMYVSPVTGALYVLPGAKDFATGDRVKCDLDMEVLSLASAAGEGADDQILMV